MKFAILGYTLAAIMALVLFLFGVPAFVAFLIFWLGGAVLTLLFPTYKLLFTADEK